MSKLRNQTFDLDVSQITKLIEAMPQFQTQIIAAAKPALRRTAEHIVTKSGQIVSKHYYIKSGDVKKTFSVVNNKLGFVWAVKSTGRRLTLAKFPHRPSSWAAYSSMRPRPTVEVKVKKPSGFKQAKNRKKGVFMIPMKSSDGALGAGIYQRAGKEKTPIYPIMTLAIPQMITSLNVAREITASANDMLTRRLDHEIVRKFQSLGRDIQR